MHELIKETLENCQGPSGFDPNNDLDDVATKFAGFALKTYTGKLLKKALKVSAALSEYNCELTYPTRVKGGE